MWFRCAAYNNYAEYHLASAWAVPREFSANHLCRSNIKSNLSCLIPDAGSCIVGRIQDLWASHAYAICLIVCLYYKVIYKCRIFRNAYVCLSFGISPCHNILCLPPSVRLHRWRQRLEHCRRDAFACTFNKMRIDIGRCTIHRNGERVCTHTHTHTHTTARCRLLVNVELRAFSRASPSTQRILPYN